MMEAQLVSIFVDQPQIGKWIYALKTKQWTMTTQTYSNLVEPDELQTEKILPACQSKASPASGLISQQRLNIDLCIINRQRGKGNDEKENTPSSGMLTFCETFHLAGKRFASHAATSTNLHICKVFLRPAGWFSAKKAGHYRGNSFPAAPTLIKT